MGRLHLGPEVRGHPEVRQETMREEDKVQRDRRLLHTGREVLGELVCRDALLCKCSRSFAMPFLFASLM